MMSQTATSAAKTRDGCSVDLYLRLPYRGEIDLIAPWLPTGCSVLELGCGVGRMTRTLLTRGYRVTAVDNSPDMLLHVPTEASKVCANIEELDLGAAFDAVILASCLINISDDRLRALQLVKCRNHLQPGGPFLFERYDPAWLSSASVGRLGNIGELEMYVDEVARNDEKVELCCRYKQDQESWSHRFTARILDDVAVGQVLSAAGFAEPIWIDRRWGAANALGHAA